MFHVFFAEFFLPLLAVVSFRISRCSLRFLRFRYDYFLSLAFCTFVRGSFLDPRSQRFRLLPPSVGLLSTFIRQDIFYLSFPVFSAQSVHFFEFFLAHFVPALRSRYRYWPR